MRAMDFYELNRAVLLEAGFQAFWLDRHAGDDHNSFRRAYVGNAAIDRAYDNIKYWQHRNEVEHRV